MDRRAFLYGAGCTLALPLLDCMAASSQELPRRACFIYFPNGVSLPPDGHPHHKDWHWFPHGHGKNYTLTKSLESLSHHRADITILQGLSHPGGHGVVGHSVGDIYLTGADIRKYYQNSISVDQLIARDIAQNTRIPSLVVSSDGGIGYSARTGTLSYNKAGQPIPAEASPRRIFNRLFGTVEGRSVEQQRAALRTNGSMLDYLVDDSKRMQRQLGHADQQKLDEYLTSVRDIELQVKRTDAWLEILKPKVDNEEVNLAALQGDPTEYIKTIYDLMFLAFRTDVTRVATYQIAREDARGVSDLFPQALGIGKGHHSLSHAAKRSGNGYEKWGQYDAFLATQLAGFLDRLKSVQEGDATLLDRTTVMYGCSTSTVHKATNYPIVIAGGKANGLKHGAMHSYTDDTPFSNALLRIAQASGAKCEKFADSTGALAEI